MSGTVEGDGGGTTSAFNPYLIAAVIASGIVAFIAFWVLSAFAPQLGSGQDGGAHALSRSATSYSAIAELLRANGTNVEINRTDVNSPGLLILTPPMSVTADDLSERINRHTAGPILIVLPRWRTSPTPNRRGWVNRAGPDYSGSTMLRREPFSIPGFTTRNARGGIVVRGITLPAEVQGMSDGIGGSSLRPLLLSADGLPVVASLASRPNIIVLADADLIANHGVATPARAAGAVALLSELSNGQPIAFDVALNGYGASRSLLRLAFTPPFLGLTLCLLAAGLFALWSGFARFGPAWREMRVVPFGKAGLVANSARLIVQARRVPHFARTYVGQVREAAARRLHAPAGLSGAALDSWLDRFPDSKGMYFSRLAGDLTAASTTIEAVARARALGQWRKDILRDSQ